MKTWAYKGESALTLLGVHLNMLKNSPSRPYDPSDFRRVMEVIEVFHMDASVVIAEAADLYPEWRPIKEHWDSLVRLYNIEKDEDEAPALYAFMQAIYR